VLHYIEEPVSTTERHDPVLFHDSKHSIAGENDNIGTNTKKQSRNTPSDNARPSVTGQRAVVIAFFLAILAVYAVTLFSFFPNMPVISRAAETIPGYDETYPPFRLDEYNYHTIAESIIDGDLYADGAKEFHYPIGFPVVAVSFVALFGEIGGYLANLLILWCAAVVFYLMVRRYQGTAGSLIITGVLAFATLNWFYATSCYTEPLSQLLVLGSFSLLTAAGAPDKRRIALFAAAGVLIGLNLFVRPHYILLALPFFGYLLFPSGHRPRMNRNAAAFASGAAVITLFWLIRNGLVFGSPLSFEYSGIAGSYLPAGETEYMEGNIFLGIHRLLFDVYHGLFTITPIFLLFPAGLRSMWVKGFRRESLLLLSSVLVMVLFVASGPYPFTEFGLGSRHLVPILPLLLLPAAYFFDFTVFRSTMLALLAAYSFYHAGIGWFTGGEPGMGFSLGILNDNQARAIILSRKGLLPQKTFKTREQLIDTYLKALRKADLFPLLQTLSPETREFIRGHERVFMIELRRQPDPTAFIEDADPGRGIRLANIIFQ